MLYPVLQPCAPFVEMPVPATHGRGVIIRPRDGMGLATVLVRKREGADLARRLRERFAIELPSAGRRTVADTLSFAATGLGAWLAMDERRGNSLAGVLKAVAGESASISDQSDAFAVLSLSGPNVRDTLSKLVSVDLHTQTFRTGDVAATVAAHIEVILWRLSDNPDGSARFEIAVSRSLATSFWHALVDSAVEYGIATTDACAGIAREDR